MNVRDAAMSFEVIKISMRQSKDGTSIVFAIQPNDVPLDLFAAPLGSRFGCALVKINDHEEPVKGPDAVEGDKAVASAGMLCRNIKFQEFLHDQYDALDISEDSAVDCLKAQCAIDSRAELKTNRAARRAFIGIVEKFEKQEWGL
jgi:hypothetical protein